jgi:hypothetical protein
MEIDYRRGVLIEREELAAPAHFGGKMQDPVSKAERYRREANKCAELAKSASPAFLGEIYQKIAVRYVFVAEELLRGPKRDVDAIERADHLTYRLRLDSGA